MRRFFYIQSCDRVSCLLAVSPSKSWLDVCRFVQKILLWLTVEGRSSDDSRRSNGLSGIAKNDAEAVKWNRLSAAQGNVFAQYSLGVMYDNGEGVPKNDVEAVKWYRRAAEQGDADAQLNLGVMYGKGEGVPRSEVDAYFWFNLAAAKGVEKAKVNRDIAEKK